MNGLNQKKLLRYIRWSVRAAFLMVFLLPLKYFTDAAIDLPVYSLVYGGLSRPLLMTPYSESVCTFLLIKWTYIGPGGWIVCPLGGSEIILTAGIMPQRGLSYEWLLLSLSVGVLLFLLLTLLLGAMFCSWVCPVGTMVDGFDKGVQRFMPKTNMKREERSKRNKEKHSSICPTCFLGKFLNSKHATVANGVIVFALVGSAVLRFPIFCPICPIGISARGMFHLKSWTRITGVMMPIMIELWIIPVVAILASLWEKRYWCRKICPVGALLRLVSLFNGFFKPATKADKCVQCKRCEKFCPQGIGPIERGKTAECTKCLECYIQCKKDAIKIKWFETPDAVLSLERFFKTKLRRPIKPQEAGLKQQ